MMDSYLDYKATVWFRIPIQDKQALEKVKEKYNKECCHLNCIMI